MYDTCVSETPILLAQSAFEVYIPFLKTLSKKFPY